VDDRSKNRIGNRLTVVTNSAKMSQMEIGGTSEVGDMILEDKGAIKSDTQVTDGR